MESRDWYMIDSDPGIFTHLVKGIGVTGIQAEELWSIEERIFLDMRPVHGLVCYVDSQELEEPEGPIVTDSRLQKIYFAKEVCYNARATHIVVSLLLNFQHPDVQLGGDLLNIKEFSMGFDPGMRGLTLTNSRVIRRVHNSMVQQPYFPSDPNMSSKYSDSTYVGYVPIDGRVYELDGRRDGPIDHGPFSPGQDWVSVVRASISRKIFGFLDRDINFTIVGLVSNRKMVNQRRLDLLINEPQIFFMTTGEISNEIRRIRMAMDYEDAKLEKYEQEMARRRHNYIPFILMLLKILAEENKLNSVLEKAKERVAKKGTKKLKV